MDGIGQRYVRTMSGDGLNDFIDLGVARSLALQDRKRLSEAGPIPEKSKEQSSS